MPFEVESSRDPALRTAFEVESLALSRAAGLTACRLALILVPAFGILDAVMFPDQFALFVALRAGAVAVLAVVMALLRRPFGERHPNALTLVTAVVVGLMVDVLTLATGGGASPRYAGLNLVLVAGALLMPWRFTWTAAAMVLVIGTYAALTIGTHRITDTRNFVTQLFFLTGTGVIGVYSTAFRERLRWREFVNRTALGDALQHRSEFMAKMSHELRTPLHVMIGYADILLDELLAKGGPEARRLVESIRSHGVTLHRLISDLLDYSKAQAGRMEIRAESLHVREVVDQVVEGFRPLVERKGLRLTTTCQGELPQLVSDRQRLAQILTNLVANAVKFTERGEVAIEARLVEDDDSELADMAFLDSERFGERVARAPAPGLVILVRDTGIGIRAESLSRLAEDFRQVDDAEERYGGTGLGLSISKRLAHLLGGRIAVRSRYAEGSTFGLFLPVDIPPLRAAA